MLLKSSKHVSHNYGLIFKNLCPIGGDFNPASPPLYYNSAWTKILKPNLLVQQTCLPQNGSIFHGGSELFLVDLAQRHQLILAE